jgi:hypothetical protein
MGGNSQPIAVDGTQAVKDFSSVTLALAISVPGTSPNTSSWDFRYSPGHGPILVLPIRKPKHRAGTQALLIWAQ